MQLNARSSARRKKHRYIVHLNVNVLNVKWATVRLKIPSGFIVIRRSNLPWLTVIPGTEVPV